MMEAGSQCSSIKPNVPKDIYLRLNMESAMLKIRELVWQIFLYDKSDMYAASLSAKGIAPERIEKYGFAFWGKGADWVMCGSGVLNDLFHRRYSRGIYRIFKQAYEKQRSESHRGRLFDRLW